MLAEWVPEKDRELETTAHRATEELCRLRWHWTLNPDNPERVSFKQYAHAVGRSPSTIKINARGYETWLEACKSEPSPSLNEHIERSNMSVEKAQAVEAIAEVYGVTFGYARQAHQKDIQSLRDSAKNKAAETGTSYPEALTELADWRKKSHEAHLRERSKMKEQHGLRFISIDDRLAKARQLLSNVLNEAHAVEWTEQEREILVDSVTKTKSLMDLIALAINGTVDVDWDAELIKLGVA